jgi:hypothetical protein
MEGFNGFFLNLENGKKLRLVTDFILNKKTYYLFDDGNFYYEENKKPMLLNKEDEKNKKIIDKLLSTIKSPIKDIIDDGKEIVDDNYIEVKPFKRS